MSRHEVACALLEQCVTSKVIPEENQGFVDVLIEEGKYDAVEEVLREWIAVTERAGNDMHGFNPTLADAVGAIHA